MTAPGSESTSSCWQRTLGAFHHEQIALYEERQRTEASLRGDIFLAAVLLQQQLHLALHRALPGCTQAQEELLERKRASQRRKNEIRAMVERQVDCLAQARRLERTQFDLENKLQQLDGTTGEASTVTQGIIRAKMDSSSISMQRKRSLVDEQGTAIHELKVSESNKSLTRIHV